MSLLLVLGLWIVLGGFVHRAQKRARSKSEDDAPGESQRPVDPRQMGEAIPDTVPTDWVEAYGGEHGE